MKIIGLMGNTGSGKSSICKMFKKQGALIIDADEISHKVILKKNPAYQEIVNFFGEGIIGCDEEIDRKKLGAIVFNDKGKLDYLSKIVHRFVALETEEIIKQAVDAYKLLVIDAPLLIEAGMQKFCDEVWLVYADEEVRLKRIMKRDNLSEEEALMRMRSQTSFEKLMPYADKIIYNNSGYKDLLEQMNDVLCY